MKDVIVELCQQFYRLGWCTGTGGGISIREGERIFMAPSGVQKERISPDDIFIVNLRGDVLEPPRNTALKLTACAPLFLAAMNQIQAGAVIHSHSVDAAVATRLWPEEFRVREVEMIKGLRGYGYYDTVRVPIIDNTAHECDLADTMSMAIEKNPHSDAILVRNHGIYVWGRDWQQAKTQTECLDYLFKYAIRMHQLGLSPV